MGTLIILAVASAGWVLWLDHQLTSRFQGALWSEPASVYARPLELYAGRSLTPEQLVTELEAADYRQASGGRQPGTWARDGDRVRLTTRAFPFPDGREPARALRLRFGDGRIQTLQAGSDGGTVDLARLDPARIGRIAPAQSEDRLQVNLDAVPVTLIGGLVAVEDRGFHRHWGISLTGIARAAWANLRAGRIVQGGSTLTQQLVKNLFLSSDRTLWRKANEAVMAVLLELRHDKRTILTAYLNEVFLAQDGRRAIHGFGLGARYFFDRPLSELSLGQQALLVGMIQAPSAYHPRRHPERARQRRDQVLAIMADTGVIPEEEARAARRAPLGVTDTPDTARYRYPAFMDLVRRHLQRDYQREDLETGGLRVFTTLAPWQQAAVRKAMDTGLSGRDEALEAAAVLADPDSGAVTALIGGRDPGFAGFNRALDARRPVGSLIKPAVYLAALERPAGWGLASVLSDRPLTLEDASGERWQPENFDERFRGDVLLIDALVHSYNVPTVRLGQAVGLTAVTDAANRLGLETPRRAYPAYTLGTAAHAPLAVARAYQTLAAEGFDTPLRAVRAVAGPDGERLQRYPLATERVVEPAPAYLLNHALSRVMREGTGEAAAERLPAGLDVAGKSGTTNDQRDSWFAGFSGDAVGVVWVGRDDNGPTGLTGSTGALPVWAEAMRRVAQRPFEPARPDAINRIWVDGDSGARSHRSCDNARRLPYHRGDEPDDWTPCGERHRDDADNGGILEGWFQ